MSTYKGIDRFCVIVLVLSLIVTALFMNGEKLGIELVSDTDAEGYAGNEYFTANDLNGSWETSEATVITLSGDAAKISSVYSSSARYSLPSACAWRELPDSRQLTSSLPVKSLG